MPSLNEIPSAVDIASPEFAKITSFCEFVPLLFKILIKISADSLILFPPEIDFGFDQVKPISLGSYTFSSFLEIIFVAPVKEISSYPSSE